MNNGERPKQTYSMSIFLYFDGRASLLIIQTSMLKDRQRKCITFTKDNYTI